MCTGDVVEFGKFLWSLFELFWVAASGFTCQKSLEHPLVFFHDFISLVLSLIMLDPNHILSNLNLVSIVCKILIDSIVAAN